MDKNTYISFFKESLQNIKKFYETEQLVLFLGAGIAKDSGLPNWQELIEKLANELNIKEINNSFDFFVNLAQKYYIQFGENIYYKNLLDIFDLESKKPNKLIDKLVNLKCKYIITTNWDDLIEKSIVNQGKFYDIIKKNDDFSKVGINTNLFIKIHGDLIDRNIVFKESDYLNYEDNYPLISNFLKSLFVRNVFLLIGYSLSDFNVKQIVSWVQNRRNKNLPIYFVEVNKNFDYLEFEYYKQKGIFVLYLKEFYNDESITNRVLFFIEDFSSDKKFAFKDEYDFIFSLCEALKPFENFNFISAFELVKYLKDKFNLYKTNEIFYLGWGNSYIYLQNEKLIRIIRRINLLKIARKAKKDGYYKKLYKCVKFIYSVFRKSIILGIDFIGNRLSKYPLIRFNARFEINNDILTFDIKNIEQKLLIEKSYFKRAFYLYKLENYYEAYKNLEIYSLEQFKERNFILYLISEFNKKNLIQILKHIQYKLDNNLKELIEKLYFQERKNSLFDLYMQLPKSYRKSIKFLLSLEEFERERIIYFLNKKEDTQKNRENRLDYFAIELDIALRDLVFFVNNNFLISDEFLSKAYRYIFESILYEYNYKKIKIIPYVFIYIAILGFSSWKDINNLFNELKLEINLSTNDKLNDIYYQVFENLLDLYLLKNPLDSTYPSFFQKYLIILLNSTLSKEDVNFIFEKFIIILNKKMMMPGDYQIIDLYVTKFHKEIKPSLLKELLETYLNKFLCGNINFYDTQTIGRDISFGLIFEVLKENKINVDIDKVKIFIKLIDKWDVRAKFFIYSYFITGLYYLVDKKDFIREKLINFTNELKNSNLEININVESTKKLIGKDKIYIEEKYLYFEYMLILKFYNILELDENFKNELKRYIKNYEGFCSCFIEIYNLIKHIQKKTNNKFYLDIEQVLKEKIDYYKGCFK